MAHLTARVKVGNTKRFEAQVIQKIQQEINTTISKNLKHVKSELQLAVRGALLLSPEVQSLLSGGKLQAEFGLEDGRDAITQIIDFWVSNIVVKSSRVTTGRLSFNQGRKRVFRSNLSISMIKADYHDVISLPAANIFTDKGVTLPWLEWLLKFGDKYIVRDYEIKYNVSSNTNSRSGIAIMVPAPKRSWRVPPEFAGTQNNNFVTRAIDSIDTKIEDILGSIFN